VKDVHNVLVIFPAIVTTVNIVGVIAIRLFRIMSILLYGTGYSPGAPEINPGFSGVRVARSLVLCVCFEDHCLSFCHFFFWPLCIMSIPTTFRLFRVLTSEFLGRRLPVSTLLL
jgi:hypothetical protein